MSEQSRVGRRDFLATGAGLTLSVILGRQKAVLGFDPEETHVLPDRPNLDALFRQTMEADHIAGMAACIIKGHGIVWSNGYGWANVEKRIKMTPDTVQNVGSVSKTMTVTAVMQLWEKGEFALDDDVSRYLTFPVKNPRHPTRPITFRHLLTHTSSVGDGPAYGESYACGDPAVPLGAWLKEYFTLGAKHYDETNFHEWAPDSRWSYSNVAFGLLGHLVETIAGMSFSAFCRANIFTPLGMNETGWRLSEIEMSKHAIPYRYVSGPDDTEGMLRENDSEEGKPGPEGYVHHCLYSFATFPDGLLRTSVRQLARLVLAYIHGGACGEKRILKERTVQEILKEQVDQSKMRRPKTQGLAWYSYTREGEIVWRHGGGDPGINTVVAFNPSNRAGLLVFANSRANLRPIEERLLREAKEFP